MMASRYFLEFLRGLGTIGLPFLLVAAAVCAMAAWQPDTEPAATFELLFIAFVFGTWSLWSYLTGPERLPFWVFGVASLMNAMQAANVLFRARLHSLEIAAVFLVCSLWQFFVYRRRFNRPQA